MQVSCHSSSSSPLSMPRHTILLRQVWPGRRIISGRSGYISYVADISSNSHVKMITYITSLGLQDAGVLVKFDRVDRFFPVGLEKSETSCRQIVGWQPHITLMGMRNNSCRFLDPVGKWFRGSNRVKLRELSLKGKKTIIFSSPL